MRTYKQHPISLFEGIWKRLFILLFPLLRGLLAFKFDIYHWATGAWFDILIISSLLIYAALRWQSRRCSYQNSILTYNDGIIMRRTSNIPSYKLTTVYMTQNPIYMILGAVSVRADTDTGSRKFSDFRMTMKVKDAKKLEEYLIGKDIKITKKYYSPRVGYLVIFSLLNSSAFTGILLLSAFISQAGAILGKQLKDELLYTLNDFSSKFARGIPPLAITISIILICGWLIGFVFNIFHYLKFNILRDSDKLIVNKGILVKKKYMLNRNRIIYYDLRQTLLTKILSISSAYLYISGYGKERRDTSALIPATSIHEIQSTMKMLLPEIKETKTTIKPPKRAWISYCMPAVFLIALIPVALLTVVYFIPFLKPFFTFSVVIAEIPAIWFFIVRFVAVFMAGIGESNSVITLKYTHGYAFHSVSMFKTKIAKVKIMRSPFNYLSGRCTIYFYSIGEHAKRHRIQGINYKDAFTFAKKFEGSQTY